MCIASAPKRYDNLFAKNPMEYIGKLGIAMCQRKYENVVLTGDTDPTLNHNWLFYVLPFLLRHCYKVGIEIQTHNYGWRGLNGINANAFSITTLRDASRIPHIKTDYGMNRLVVLGTAELLELFLKEDIDLSQFRQLTFKALQHTASNVASVDQYIDGARCDSSLLDKAAEKYRELGLQVKIDLNCQDAAGRYAILREDGKVYDSWDQ
jgi:hypothetical protein